MPTVGARAYPLPGGRNHLQHQSVTATILEIQGSNTHTDTGPGHRQKCGPKFSRDWVPVPSHHAIFSENWRNPSGRRR